MAVNGSVSKEVTSKQSKFVDALLVGTTVTIAAKTAGISPRTAARWKKEHSILAELQCRRKALFNETLDAFRAGLPTAMALVLETIKDKETPRSVRLRAAQIWIEHALEINKMEELENRIADLERRIR
jgi:phage terminase small subunit